MMPDEESMKDPFVLAGKEYQSRLIVGTGKDKDFAETKRAIAASGSEIVTVAVRRVNITDSGKENLLDYIDPKVYTILPNTAGCYSAEEAVRTCRLARAAGIGNIVKLEVIGDERTLFPDIPATLEAARILVKEGFIVLPYIQDDPISCKKLEEIGCAAVLMNTAIAGAKDPILMAEAMRLGVEAGRKAFLAGRIAKKLYATASSPLEGILIIVVWSTVDNFPIYGINI